VSERIAADEGEATPDPTRSETRLRRPADVELARASRPSVRPSAFGPPRASSRPEPLTASTPVASTLPTDAATAAHEQHGFEPSAASALHSLAAPETHARFLPAFFSALPSLRPAWREGGGSFHGRARRPLVSIALFCSMLGLSAVTLLRYAGPAEPRHTKAPAGPARADDARRVLQSEAALAPKAGIVVRSRDRPAEGAPAPQEPDRASLILALRQQGDRALMRRNTREAEEIYAHILELEEGNARAAYGLAQVRLAQGNLPGAEGWIQLAIRRRPRRAVYHALYAEILTQLGRQEEALEERLHAAGGAPTEPAEQAAETGVPANGAGTEAAGGAPTEAAPDAETD
jgi:hypothetical protein